MKLYIRMSIPWVTDNTHMFVLPVWRKSKLIFQDKAHMKPTVGNVGEGVGNSHRIIGINTSNALDLKGKNTIL